MLFEPLLSKARTSWRRTWVANLYDILPPILFNISLLPFVFVTVLSDWLGKHSFFCFILAHLVYYPGGNTVGAHVEQAVLGTVLSTLCLGLSYLIVCIQVWIDEPNPIYTSKKTRGLGACYLFVVFFIAGMVWSKVPRLRTPLRALMFVQIWALTGSSSSISSENFTQLFYPLIVTAGLSFAANILFPRTGRDAYFQAACRGLKTTMEVVDVAVNNFDSELRQWLLRSHAALESQGKISLPPPPIQSPEFIQLRKSIDECIGLMRLAVAATTHEIAWCRVPVTNMADVLGYLVDFKTWISCGFGLEVPLLPFELSTRKYKYLDEEEDETAFRDTAAYEPHQDVGDAHEHIQQDEENLPSSVQSTPAIPKNDLPEIMGQEKPMKELYSTLQDALAAVLVVTEVCYGQTPTTTRPGTLELAQALQQSTSQNQACAILSERKKALQQSIQNSRVKLHKMVQSRQRLAGEYRDSCEKETAADETKSENKTHCDSSLHEPSLFRSDMCALSFYSLSLIEVSYRTVSLLESASDTVEFYEKHPKDKIYLPVLNFSNWFYSSSGIGLFQNVSENTMVNSVHSSSSDDGQDASNAPDKPFEKKNQEKNEDDLPELFDDVKRTNMYQAYAMNTVRASNTTSSFEHKFRRPFLFNRIRQFVHRFSRKPRVLRARIQVSAFCRRWKQSRHVRFGLKLASGVVLLCIPAFVLPGSNSWWSNNHGQWMVISFVWCLESYTGDSIRMSLCRILGTISGVIMGIISFEISRGNKYGLGVLVVLCEAVASSIRMHTSLPPLGTVMGVTVPVVALVTFFNEYYDTAWLVGVTRGYMICIGIVAALLINTFIWPYHARIKLGQKLSWLASDLQTMYMNLTRHMFYAGFYVSPESHARFADFERKLRANISKCYLLINVMNNEISLVPKPTVVMTQMLVRLESIFDLLVGLRMCREHGLQSLRQKVIWDVANLRQEMASTVMLNLWIIGQSMLTRSRMPQFLPSTRRTLEELTAALAHNLGEVFYDRNQQEVIVPRDSRHIFDAPNLQYRARDYLMKTQTHVQPHNSVVTLHLAGRTPAVPSSTWGSLPPNNTPSADGVLYLLSEHVLLSQLVSCLEALLHLNRYLLGELQIVRADPIV